MATATTQKIVIYVLDAVYLSLFASRTLESSADVVAVAVAVVDADLLLIWMMNLDWVDDGDDSLLAMFWHSELRMMTILLLQSKKTKKRNKLEMMQFNVKM